MKVFRYIEKYLIYASPAVIACMIWSAAQKESDILMPSRILWEILSWNLMLWFVLLTLFVVSLLFISPAREDFFKRVASIHERDEREEQLAGIVAKRTFISMLSLLVFLFLISAFSFNIRKLPPEQEVNGKSATASISLALRMFDEPREKKDVDGIAIVESKDIPFSKSTLLLILIFWQLLAYRLFYWRETRIV